MKKIGREVICCMLLSLLLLMASTALAAESSSYGALSYGSVVEQLLAEETDDGLELTFKVTNNEDYPYSVAHRDGQVFDFAILSRGGSVLWRWSDGMAFTMALTSSSVAPHSSVVYRAAIPAKDYKEFKDKAFLVSAWIVDTPLRLSTRVPKETRIWINL